MGDENWTKDWRVAGIPQDTRYASPQAAIRAQRRVQRMKPGRIKGKKETGGRRPSYITAERIHHSRGKKWEEFLVAMGFDMLSELEQQCLFDSFKLGGNELFAKWKQRQYEAWVPVKIERVFNFHNRKVLMVRMPDGTVKEVPYVDPDEKKKVKKSRRPSKPKYCECGMRIPTGQAASRMKCTTCQPAISAESFFAGLNKKPAVK